MKICSALILSALAIATVNTRAAFITIDDSVSGSVTISAGDFENNFRVNGITLSNGLFSSGSLTVSAGTTLDFTGSWITDEEPLPPSQTWYIINPANPSVVEDILSVEFGEDGYGYIFGTFASNVNLPLPPELPSGNSLFLEGPSALDFSAPFSGNVVIFQSEETSPVPEVQTYASLFGAALIGAQVWRRKRAA